MEGRTIAWVGDGNNVCASFIHVGGTAGFSPSNVATPADYHPDLIDLSRAGTTPDKVELTNDPRVGGSKAPIA